MNCLVFIVLALLAHQHEADEGMTSSPPLASPERPPPPLLSSRHDLPLLVKLLLLPWLRDWLKVNPGTATEAAFMAACMIIMLFIFAFCWFSAIWWLFTAKEIISIRFTTYREACLAARDTKRLLKEFRKVYSKHEQSRSTRVIPAVRRRMSH
ncbi:hypothetical protein PENTCL1PPCAC_5125 [Pristionchus entomophagus]|uniref:Uncharacterized protein n=1 Tax=Pristionchus entomophagus TaxID=358040 RepID=A0AAV5SSA6_9BILA|nr:hypothetical protein PENTCL1PPCAC_5125 [Pristionchus entomophagus]